MVIERLGTPVL